MPSPDSLIERFQGGDPILGTQALHELLALGDAGEEELFSRSIEFPKTAQVRRRWLRYVASREKTVVRRLVERMETQDSLNDAYAAAHLFAGIREDRKALDPLYDQLAAGFHEGRPTPDTIRNHSEVSRRLVAWGYAGGDAGTLWHFMESSFAWEKLVTFAFRGACAAAARMSANDLWGIEQLITHMWQEYLGLVEISDSPDATISHEAINAQEIWMRANDAFLLWRRGEIADRILRDWARHAHWRVRDFGAQILASLGFQRTVKPVVEWLRREPLPSVRISLLHALARSETASGTDVLIEHYESSGQEGEPYVAKAAWRASDKDRALKVLSAIGEGESFAAAEALVSLARLGHRPARLAEMLNSHNSYHRLNAALAVAYLGERGAMDQLVALQREAATPSERVYIAAALAILGKPNGAADLNEELVAAAGAKDFQQREDLFFVHRYLQTAVLDGLAAGGAQTRDFLNAWRAEMEPLDPVPQPVALAGSKPVVAVGVDTRSLKVFISYSHKDEKMRVKLGEHLASLVTEGLIRIWHDREIEAGANWEAEINQEIEEADIILLLVSAPFLNSPYCRKELLRALEQRDAGKSLPIPILLRPCDWMSVFNREDYKAQALPRDDRPVSGGGWPNQDVAFATIVKELRTRIERMRRSG